MIAHYDQGMHTLSQSLFGYYDSKCEVDSKGLLIWRKFFRHFPGEEGNLSQPRSRFIYLSLMISEKRSNEKMLSRPNEISAECYWDPA